MLQQEGTWNDLSPKFRQELENQVSELGKTVKFKFNISRPNPDPQKYNGAIIYPFMYTLDPITFKVTDTYETRDQKQKVKNIGMIMRMDDNKPIFRRVRINESDKGILTLNLENPDDIEMAMYCLLHPKLENGKFADRTKTPMFVRIDTLAAAKEEKEIRSNKLKALIAAQKMSDKEVVQFSDAMMWDTTENIEYLRNQVEALAETSPEYFNEFINGNNLEYQALIKQAIDNNIIVFDPIEYKFSYTSSNMVIAVLSPIGDKNEIVKLSEWMQTAGKKADEVYKKLKSLLEGKSAKSLA
jgi:hypothetical protein